MCVQTLRPKLAVRCLDEAVICWLSGPREGQRDVVGIGPQIQVAGDELATTRTLLG